MNRLQILLLIGFIISCVGCSNSNELRVSGKILNGEGKALYFQKMNLDETMTLDSVVLKEKGTFDFSVPRLEFPSFFLLKLSDSNFITLLGDSIERIEVNGDAASLSNTYVVKNSMGSSYVKTLNRKLESTKDGIDSLVTIYNSLSKENTEQRQKTGEDILEIIKNQKDFISDFVMNNPRSFASYYAVFQRYDDGQLILNAYEKRDLSILSTVATSLGILYPQSPRVKQLTNFILSIRRENKQNEMQEKLLSKAQENPFPEIEENDVNGKAIKLSSLKGKMILLSFWASWDERSVAENKRLLKIYNKYKAKGFEIYQVSLDRSKILWEGAIEKNKLPWINVSDLQYTNSSAARIYNVKQLPANYLISKEGEIIGKNLFGRILDEKLKDLLK